jgi:pyruvate,orthophosphate dikinase
VTTGVRHTLVYPLDFPHVASEAERVELLGGKAANLGVMSRDLGLPVPPGFVVTTEACRDYLENGWPDGLGDELQSAMASLETTLGRRFGNPRDPLLVSVRSGAAVSMPGMMDTILDLGLNDDGASGLAAVTGYSAFAADCLARFRTMFRDVVGADAPDDPWRQLRLAIEAVFRSWNGDRARAYRAKEGIPDSLGTGVTVQAMVFGNRSANSATGVVFTRNPATGEAGLYGDVLFNAQGEDVVAGTHATEPIAALDARLPDAAAALRRAAHRLEHHYRDLCDIEFTVEDGRLWLLQVRVGKRSPRAALRMAIDMAEEGDFPLSRAEAVARVAPLLADPPRIATGGSTSAAPLIAGVGASPGVASGDVVLTPDEAVRAADRGRAVILVRAETSPDDVHGISRAAGILTARGGLASHAAVVARGWGIPAVVGAAGLVLGDGEIQLNGQRVAAGDTITIDGDSGHVYRGATGGSTQVCPEAITLAGWAKELGIELPVAMPAEPTRGNVGDPVSQAPQPDELVAAIAVKGMATTDALCAALGTTPDAVTPMLDALAASGEVTTTAGAFRLTDAGKQRRAGGLETERSRMGDQRANAALDAFIAIDGRVKETVTAWQLRTVNGAQLPNDHRDPDYDAGVLTDLVVTHEDALEWLDAIGPGWPRAYAYRRRLTSAVTAALAGDGRFVASPRVDSYHGAWFELHEELIALAGRTREEEVAAGRA